MATPIPRARYKAIAIEQQSKGKNKNVVQFDVYRVISTLPNGNYFELSNELKTSDFERAIKRSHLQPLGIVVCDFNTNSEFITLPRLGRTIKEERFVIKSQLHQFNPNDKNHNNQYTPLEPLNFCCPIPQAIVAQNLILSYQKDMLNYALLSNVKKYVMGKNQTVGEFRTYFISEILNSWSEIHYQLNPNEYPYISLKPA